MFRIVAKKNGISEVLDTTDNSIDKCTDSDLKEYQELGIKVQGVLQVNNTFKSCKVMSADLREVNRMRKVLDTVYVESGKVKVNLDGKQVVCASLPQLDNKREARAEYVGFFNNYHVLTVEEYPTGTGRDFYKVVTYTALLSPSQKLALRLCDTGIKSTARTRCTGNKFNYIDLFSTKHNCFFCSMFVVDSLTECLETIMLLDDNNILFVTSDLYSGRDADGTIDANEYHLYSFDFTTKKCTKLASEMCNNDETVLNLELNMFKIKEVYGFSSFCHLAGLPKFTLGDFVDKYSV